MRGRQITVGQTIVFCGLPYNPHSTRPTHLRLFSVGMADHKKRWSALVCPADSADFYARAGSSAALPNSTFVSVTMAPGATGTAHPADWRGLGSMEFSWRGLAVSR